MTGCPELHTSSHFDSLGTKECQGPQAVEGQGAGVFFGVKLTGPPGSILWNHWDSCLREPAKELPGAELPRDLPFQIETPSLRGQWKGSKKTLDLVKEGNSAKYPILL